MDAIDSAINPIRPQLQALTRNLPKAVSDAAESLLGEACSQRLLNHLDFSSSNAECLRLTLSKALGLGIVGASAVVKVPQLIKLVNSQSAEGLSFLSYVLETASFVITLAYNVRNQFPFSTYGETAFIAVQDVLIAVLILFYSGRSGTAATFVAGLAAAGYALFSPSSPVDMNMMGVLAAGAGVLGVASKVPQIVAIWQKGGTGQLSAFAVFNYLAGSLTRIFTTLQEVDDKTILYGFLAGFTFNAILAGQLIYYWNAPNKSSKRSTKKTKNQKATGSTTGSTTATPASTVKTRGPSTRRRG